MKVVVILNDERQTVKQIENVLEIRNYNNEIEIEYIESPLVKGILKFEITHIKDIKLSEFKSIFKSFLKGDSKQ